MPLALLLKYVFLQNTKRTTSQATEARIQTTASADTEPSQQIQNLFSHPVTAHLLQSPESCACNLGEMINSVGGA